MSFDQIIEEIEKLSPAERDLVQQKLDALHQEDDFEMTPELEAAIEEGIRSAEYEPSIPLEEMEKRMALWRSKRS